MEAKRQELLKRHRELTEAINEARPVIEIGKLRATTPPDMERLAKLREELAGVERELDSLRN